MINYNGFNGTYPFDTFIGTVAVQPQEDKEKEAATALFTALELYGNHVVVQPE